MHSMPLTPVAGDGQRLFRTLIHIANLMAFVVVIACLYWGKTVLLPVAMALLLTFLLQPVVALFQRIGLGRTLSVLLGPLGTAAFIVVLVIFMLLKHEDLRNRLISLVGAGQLSVTTRALDDAGQRISRYLLMQCIINGSYGVAMGLGLFFLGVPYPVLWGFLAAVLRYIPYVGPWIALLFPITISLVAFPGWGQLALVLGLFLLLDLWSNLLMEPWLYGYSIGVSEVGLLVVTGFWTWLWGPIGLVLATPLTVCLVVLGRHVPHLYFFDMLLGSTPALDPPIIY